MATQVAQLLLKGLFITVRSPSSLLALCLHPAALSLGYICTMGVILKKKKREKGNLNDTLCVFAVAGVDQASHTFNFTLS